LKGDPLQFRVGEGRIISGFEQAVLGMSPGETKNVKVPPEEAFGEYQPGMVTVLERSKFPEDVRVGQQFQVGQTSGQPSVLTVTKISEKEVTVDGNHPLAGQDLILDIQLVEVK
jgi:peptidylprolyl isomerase